jgi:acyl carrier protein
MLIKKGNMNLNTLKIVNNIFIEVFKDANILLDKDTSSNDIERWDSLNNMHLVVALERHFKIRITLKDIQSWRNVGDLCEWISQKIEE